jgi:hypothetical protein
MIKTMRRILGFSSLFILLTVPVFVFGAEAPSKEFVSLTDFSGIEELGNSSNFEFFLNNLYKLTVGLAAAIAVFQIIIAGITYMGGDSFTEKKAAREKITMSILGLLLVLSPIIVFSIINPEILNLKLNLGGIRTNIENTPDGGADGDPATDDPVGPGALNPGYYFTKIEDPNEPWVKSFISTCNIKSPDATVSDAVADYKATSLGAKVGANNAVMYTAACESFSTQIMQYSSIVRHPETGMYIGKATPGKVVPQMERADLKFRNGCQANGGRLVVDKEFSEKQCPEGLADSIRPSNVEAKNFVVNCSAYEMECRAPK